MPILVVGGNVGVEIPMLGQHRTKTRMPTLSRLGTSVTTQGGSGRQCVTGPGRNIPKYRFVLLNVYRFWET